LQLCPPYKPGTREVAETPSQVDLDAILNNPAGVEQLRLRLSNPSWLMRFLTESRSRGANREDQSTGRLWEGRFKMQRLLDEWAVTTCLVSVDLNPIRAGITSTLSQSENTAVFECLAGVVHSFATTDSAQQRQEYGLDGKADVRSTPPAVDRTGGEGQLSAVQTSDSRANATRPNGSQTAPPAGASTPADPKLVDRTVWSRLPPDQVNEASSQAAFDGPATWLASLQITESALQRAVPGTGATNLGCLNMTFTQYLELMEWAGRQVHAGKFGRIPADAPPTLQQLGLQGEDWLKLVASFHSKRGGQRRAVARPAALEVESGRAGRATHCVRLFEEPVGVGISRFMTMSSGELAGLLPAGARGAAETGGLWFTQPPTGHVTNLCGSAGVRASRGLTPHGKSAEPPYSRWRPAHGIKPQSGTTTRAIPC
jgi:hypothetical protein